MRRRFRRAGSNLGEKVRGHRRTMRSRPAPLADELYDAIETLTPASDEQRPLKLRIAQAGTDIAMRGC